MKTFFLTTIVAVFLLLCTNGIQAQNAQTKLNHVDLKQYEGNWKCEIAKDTTNFRDFKSYGTGFVNDWKIVTKETTVNEWIISFGYVMEIDKYIIGSKGQDINVYASWFISERKMLIISYSDISNPENASWKMTDEYMSPDIFIETTLVDNKPVWSGTYTRIK